MGLTGDEGQRCCFDASDWSDTSVLNVKDNHFRWSVNFLIVYTVTVLGK